MHCSGVSGAKQKPNTKPVLFCCQKNNLTATSNWLDDEIPAWWWHPNLQFFIQFALFCPVWFHLNEVLNSRNYFFAWVSWRSRGDDTTNCTFFLRIATLSFQWGPKEKSNTQLSFKTRLPNAQNALGWQRRRWWFCKTWCQCNWDESDDQVGCKFALCVLISFINEPYMQSVERL